MDAIGALSSYALAMQQVQMSIAKQSISADQQLAEVLLEASRSVPSSSDKGANLDISI